MKFHQIEEIILLNDTHNAVDVGAHQMIEWKIMIRRQCRISHIHLTYGFHVDFST